MKGRLFVVGVALGLIIGLPLGQWMRGVASAQVQSDPTIATGTMRATTETARLYNDTGKLYPLQPHTTVWVTEFQPGSSGQIIGDIAGFDCDQGRCFVLSH